MVSSQGVFSNLVPGVNLQEAMLFSPSGFRMVWYMVGVADPMVMCPLPHLICYKTFPLSGMMSCGSPMILEQILYETWKSDGD